MVNSVKPLVTDFIYCIAIVVVKKGYASVIVGISLSSKNFASAEFGSGNMSRMIASSDWTPIARKSTKTFTGFLTKGIVAYMAPLLRLIAKATRFTIRVSGLSELTLA